MGSTSTEGTADCVVIDLEPKARWAESLRQQAEAATSHQKDGRVAGPCTIFRVPTAFRGARSDDYRPKFISLGPYHCNEPELKATNHHKLRYLHKILKRNEDAKLEDYLSKIKELEAGAQSSYSEEIKMGSREFVEMLLLDACFIVQLLLMQSSDTNIVDQIKEMEEDPIHSSKWILPQIRYDMLIFENQIPFFILQGVFDLATGSAAPNQISLTKHIIWFMGHLIPGECINLPRGWESSPPQLHHILHLFNSYILHSSTLVMHESYLPSDESNAPSHEIHDNVSPCATKLKNAGVVFKGKAAQSFLDVTFENGIVEIPTVAIYNHTPSLFRNLIAFEVCFGKSGMYIAAYAAFMDCLIDTGNDVALLHKTKCTLNALANDDAPAALLNELGDIEIEGCKDYLVSLHKKLNKHYNSRRNRWRATLMRDYFSSPWAVISIVAALIVIFLTFIQTLYAPLAYYNPHS